MLSDLPIELLYTILSHRLGDIIFQHLFLDALVADGQFIVRWQAHPPNNASDTKLTPNTLRPLSEIVSLTSVCARWRAVLWRILGAVLAFDREENDENAVPSLSGRTAAANHMTSRIASCTIMHTGKHALPTSPVTHQHIVSLQAHASDHLIGVASHNYSKVSLYPIQPYLSTLRMMQRSLRTLIQHSIDMYKEEQEASNGFVGTTGVVTPPHPGTLTPTSTFAPTTSIIPAPGGASLQATTTHSTVGGLNGQTLQSVASPAPLTPLSILPHILEEHTLETDDESSGMLASPIFSPTEPSRPNSQSDSHTLYSTDATSVSPAVQPDESQASSPSEIARSRRHWMWGSNPLFIDALGYTQSSLFTCSRSSTHRSDLSLALTVGRLQGASELLDRIYHGCGVVDKYGRIGLVRPKEVAEVIQYGVEGARQRVQEALQVCEWNDLLDRVFLRGERSDELIGRLPTCFDSMEKQARSIQMLHLLRSGLFKTTQTVGRMSAISLYPSSSPSSLSGGLDHSSSNDGSSARSGDTSTASALLGGASVAPESRLSLPKEWKTRAANLSMLWTGRVIEWTGF
ncbi:hypothetical protein FRC17_000876 [Serendipita sp. 399]|nr:hypothetical protein FRC17_000876 [Serendipita sp. 399]